MASVGIRIYTAVIAIVCGAAIAWSIHQSSIASAWQADSLAWHGIAQRTVLHDRVTTRRLRRLVVQYDHLVVRTRRSQTRLLADIRKAERARAAAISVPQQTVYGNAAAAAAAAPAPAAVPPPAAPVTSTSPTT
jgi:hypothetical protein